MTAVPPQETSSEPFDLGKELRALVLATAPRLFAVPGSTRTSSRDGVTAQLVWLAPATAASLGPDLAA
ncbi:hypothetical protein ACWGMA_06785 [Streptomyces asiaticus]